MSSRDIAETHYKLGIVHAQSKDYYNAKKSWQDAIHVLEQRVANLKRMEMGENILKELLEVDARCDDIKKQLNDYKKDM